MTRSTSITTYHTIKSGGLLSKLRFEVYDVLFHHGPLSANELWHDYLQSHQQHSILPRFAELEQRGVIAVVRERPCRITGRQVLEWDVTSKLPVEPPKKETSTEKIKRLEKEVARLTKVNKNLMELVDEYEKNGKSIF